MTAFHSRAELGMAAPRSVSTNITPGRGGVTVHYGGGAQRVATPAEARARWLAWQRFHMVGRGWVDIAYNFGFDDWGNVYAGRGLGVRSAANGTNEGNQVSYAACWIGGHGETPSALALEALNWIIEQARADGGAGLGVYPHSHWKATACPGNPLRNRAADLDGRQDLPANFGDLPTPPPPTPPIEERNYITLGDKGPEVRSWQEKLMAWGPNDPDAHAADGDFGPKTARWTTRFLLSVGLTPRNPERPAVGPKTREAMEEALAEDRFGRLPPEDAFSFAHSALIRRGDRGPAVTEWQRALQRWSDRALPKWGSDGDFGAETADWTRRFMVAAGLVASSPDDPVVGPRTRDAMVRVLSGGTSVPSSGFEMGPFPGRLLRQPPILRGDDVAQFQRGYNAWKPRSLKVDGAYGPVSEEACRAVQRHGGARVDGVVGPVTWRVLRRLVR